MADDAPKAPAPPPPPRSAPAALAPARAAAKAPTLPAPKRMGFDPTRPFRFGWNGLTGSIKGTLDGMASLGRKGAFAGLAFGVLMCIGAGMAPGILIGGFGIGLLGGAVIGGLVGGATGGVKGVQRAYRREKYADELAEHQAARATRPVMGRAPSSGYDYRDVYQAQRRAANYNYERGLQQDYEDARTAMSYQDREEMRRNHAHGRGL